MGSISPFLMNRIRVQFNNGMKEKSSGSGVSGWIGLKMSGYLSRNSLTMTEHMRILKVSDRYQKITCRSGPNRIALTIRCTRLPQKAPQSRQ